MNFIGIDLEGVLIPEIWVSLAEKTGINELKLTTKDISDYKELMKIRIDILKKKQIQSNLLFEIASEIKPYEGAMETIEGLYNNKKNYIFLSNAPRPVNDVRQFLIEKMRINKKFLNNIKNISKYFLKNLNIIKDKYPNIIKQIRGKGLLIGIQLHKDQTLFIKKLMENKLLTIKAAENVIRILPPLNVKRQEIDIALKVINKVCSEIE